MRLKDALATIGVGFIINAVENAVYERQHLGVGLPKAAEDAVYASIIDSMRELEEMLKGGELSREKALEEAKATLWDLF